MTKRVELYRDQSKSVYTSGNEQRLIFHFRNDAFAFDEPGSEQLDRLGEVNNKFNYFIMCKLESAGIATQIDRLLSDRETLVRRLDMIPLECVVRNVAAGSLCRRLGVKEGTDLSPPTFELFLKNDVLHDPMVNESLCESLGFATPAQLSEIKAQTYKVNTVLSQLFDDAGMLLVDYKLEFGIDSEGKLFLGDEFTPESCRLWDKETRVKLDKDRFRLGADGIITSYIEVARRIGLDLSEH
ncbi:phosphoribosylaminoimidazolesuccinocarboxamide synthase [Veronia nyctiphanis]|uniref:Phosphoribosylaminoimidazole-succinocarboxamide synthase n=1 Tax=Veronia nyctiphanis TaxID=1278244 RepID=A0A4Q0YQN8_9GAMM|nr:phosphoribosylaminoimidazolesuccinocarboxamide synthase [Veronia nyctiphanis]RXJ71449.1 phosphoribosylaminoimidazolesuccinocarboxamide synthase [Veronia nyctiphanis]